MKKTIIFISFIISACYMDYLAEIAIIKNTGSRTILIIERTDSVINDSIFYEQYKMANTLDPNEVITLTWPNIKPRLADDSIKEYVFIYDMDQVNAFNHKSSGIHKKALLKKVIQLNHIKNPIDTTFID